MYIMFYIIIYTYICILYYIYIILFTYINIYIYIYIVLVLYFRYFLYSIYVCLCYIYNIFFNMHTTYMLWLNQYPVFGFVNIPLPMICVVMSKCYSNSSWSNEASSKVPTRRTLIHWVLQFTPAFQFHIIVRTPTIKEIHLPFEYPLSWVSSMLPPSALLSMSNFKQGTSECIETHGIRVLPNFREIHGY